MRTAWICDHCAESFDTEQLAIGHEAACDMAPSAQVKNVLDTISDLVSDFLYYDRREDEDLPPGAIDALVISGDLTINQMVRRFSAQLRTGIKS